MGGCLCVDVREKQSLFVCTSVHRTVTVISSPQSHEMQCVSHSSLDDVLISPGLSVTSLARLPFFVSQASSSSTPTLLLSLPPLTFSSPLCLQCPRGAGVRRATSRVPVVTASPACGYATARKTARTELTSSSVVRTLNDCSHPTHLITTFISLILLWQLSCNI